MENAEIIEALICCVENGVDLADRTLTLWRLPWKLKRNGGETIVVSIVVENAQEWPLVEIAWKLCVTSHLLRQSPQNPIAVCRWFRSS